MNFLNLDDIDIGKQGKEDFKANILNGAPISADFSHEGDTLLIAFGGGAHRFGMPDSAALGFFSRLNANVIFLRDPNLLYSFGGIPGLGNDVDSIAKSLQSVIRKNDIRKLVVSGTSMGGYISLLYGILLNANTIHSFMPRTSAKFSYRYFDKFKGRRLRLAWLSRIIRVNILGSKYPAYLDIKDLMEGRPRFTGKINLHYRTKNVTDSRHCKRLAGFKQVALKTYEGKRHNVIIDILENGTLERLFRDAID